jgi:hypothetical protein
MHTYMCVLTRTPGQSLPRGFAAVGNTAVVANAVCVLVGWSLDPLFLSVYAAELGLKVYALGSEPFRRSAWNMYACAYLLV